GRETGGVQCGEQETHGDAHAFLDVVMLDLAVAVEAVVDAEYDDEIGGDLEKFLVPVGAEGVERVQPFLRETMLVIFALFGFGGFADGSLDLGVRHDNEAPWLLIRSAGRIGGAADGVFDQLEGDGVAGKCAHGAARRHGVDERAGAAKLLAGRESVERKRLKLFWQRRKARTACARRFDSRRWRAWPSTG